MTCCKFRGTCVALTSDGQDYCALHQPEALVKRIEGIISSRFNKASLEGDLVTLPDLRHQILTDIRLTV